MKTIHTFLSVNFICLVLVAGVNALTLTSAEGVWTGTSGGSYVRYIHDATIDYGNGLEDQVFWGSPATHRGQSGLGFTGSASADTPLNFEFGDAFTIGQLRHFNNPIYTGSAANQAFLDISLGFSDPAGLDDVFNMTFGIDETTNTSDREESADHITISDAYAVQVFEFSGVEYTFEFLGFGDTADDLIPSFTSYEEMTNDTELWGKITAVNPVPEPTTMLLFGFGLLGMANVARRKLG